MTETDLVPWVMRHSLILIFLILFYNCNIPKDPNDSWQNAKRNALRVGVVILNDENSQKMEVLEKEKSMVEEFAQINNLKIKSKQASETELTKLLEEYKLDIMIGGFEKKSNWKKVVGMTTPYDSTHVFFIPKGENKLLFHLEKFILTN